MESTPSDHGATLSLPPAGVHPVVRGASTCITYSMIFSPNCDPVPDLRRRAGFTRAMIGGSMKTLSTFAGALLFLSACILGWVILPVFLIVSGAALLVYAVVVEVGVTVLGLRSTVPDPFAARKMADRLCGGLRN